MGINEISENKSFNIFPNPSSGNITILLKEKMLNEEFSLELLNLNGQIIYRKNYKLTNTVININLPDITKGMYLIKLQSKDYTMSEKLIIE